MNTATNPDQQLSDYLTELKKCGKNDIFQTCEKLSQYARELIYNDQADRLKTCLNAVELFYHKVNHTLIKLAIENVFIYKIGNAIMLQPKRHVWTRLLPKTLKEKMYQQFLASGI